MEAYRCVEVTGVLVNNVSWAATHHYWKAEIP
jgi:hypothetical protein